MAEPCKSRCRHMACAMVKEARAARDAAVARAASLLKENARLLKLVRMQRDASLARVAELGRRVIAERNAARAKVEALEARIAELEVESARKALEGSGA